MLWQGAKWRILKNFILQNEECHHYDVYVRPFETTYVHKKV